MVVVSGAVATALISVASGAVTGITLGTGVDGDEGAGTGAMEAPQALQNLALRLFSVWHLPQGRLLSVAGAGVSAAVRRSWPQPLQNFALSLFSVAHFEHEMAMFFS